MALDPEKLEQLLMRPTESLNAEIKTWLDLRTPEGVAKLVKAAFALRNRNGGTLTIGFNDLALTPDPYSLVGDIKQIFHLDVVQGHISKFANQPFEVKLDYPTLNGVVHPIISVPEGVRIPVVVKSDLQEAKLGKSLLTKGDLYFRTLKTNGTPSTAKINSGDYEELLEICFENREADIGRFLRRHLGGTEREAILNAASFHEPNLPTVLRDRCSALMERGTLAFTAASATRVVTQATLWMPTPPLTLQAALCLHPPRADVTPTQDFLRAFASGNPNYTGWPIWLDSRSFSDEQSRPRVKDGAWQAFALDLEGDFPHSDFMLLDPHGDFYLRRVMQDDLRRKNSRLNPVLDTTLMLCRVAEVFAVGLSAAKSCGWLPDGTAGFNLRWIGLANRSLSAWANPPHWDAGESGTAHDGEATSFVTVPLDTPLTALAPFVSRAVAPLFSAFDGYVPPTKLVEDCVRRLIERKMG